MKFIKRKINYLESRILLTLGMSCFCTKRSFTSLPVLCWVIFAVHTIPVYSAEPCHGNFSFTDNFGQRDDSEITTFTHETQGFSATFEGGLVRNNPAPLANTWSILPAGDTIEGISNGQGVISLSKPAKQIDIDLVAGDDVNARIQFIDSSEAVYLESFIENGESFTYFNSDYDLPGIIQVKIIIDGGSDESRVYYFGYDDVWEYTCGDGVGLLDIKALFGISFILAIYLIRRRLDNG